MASKCPPAKKSIRFTSNITQGIGAGHVQPEGHIWFYTLPVEMKLRPPLRHHKNKNTLYEFSDGMPTDERPHTSSVFGDQYHHSGRNQDGDRFDKAQFFKFKIAV